MNEENRVLVCKTAVITGQCRGFVLRIDGTAVLLSYGEESVCFNLDHFGALIELVKEVESARGGQ